LYDKFCTPAINSYFLWSITFLLISIPCQLFSYKFAAVSQDYYLLFYHSGVDPREKFKAFERYDRARLIGISLNYGAMFSFAFACIALISMFWTGI
jgi:hypothetical protein